MTLVSNCKQTNKQPTDPTASLLLTSDKAIFCKIFSTCQHVTRAWRSKYVVQNRKEQIIKLTFLGLVREVRWKNKEEWVAKRWFVMIFSAMSYRFELVHLLSLCFCVLKLVMVAYRWYTTSICCKHGQKCLVTYTKGVSRAPA